MSRDGRREVLILEEMPPPGESGELLEAVLRDGRTLVILRPRMSEVLPMIREALLHGDGSRGLGVKVESMGRQGPLVIAPAEAVVRRRRGRVTVVL